jgi:hypothetical protein
MDPNNKITRINSRFPLKQLFKIRILGKNPTRGGRPPKDKNIAIDRREMFKFFSVKF